MSRIGGMIRFAIKGPYSYSPAMKTTLVGYARCSTNDQGLTAQKQALENLGVAPDRIYTDHGLTGTNRARPGLDQAIAAVREGDTFVVPKLDRLARSVPDARAIADQLEAKGVKLALGASVYDPTDPMGISYLCRIRSRSHPHAHQRRHGYRSCKRKTAGQAAEAI